MPSAGDNIANLDDVAQFAKGLSNAMLLCRMNRRHIQDPNKTNVVRPTRHDSTYAMEGPCIICGQTVRRTFDEFFGRIRTSLSVDYDPDYLMPKGSGRVDATGGRRFVQEFMERAGVTPKKRAPRKRAAKKAAAKKAATTPRKRTTKKAATVTPINVAKGA